MATPAQLNLSETQFANAKGIIAAVKKRGWTSKAAVIAIETALTESGMRMIASANVPKSQEYPHEKLGWTSDGLGHDHASCGMFQQQTGYRWTPAGYGSAMNQTTMNSPDGWGTPAELMNAELSTTKFLNALANVDWRAMNNWNAAQAVQHSAFPDGSNYRQADAHATQIVNALWTSVTPDSGKGSPMIVIVTASGKGIAQIVDGGKYHLGPGEWAAIKAIRAKVPSAVAVATISAAQWDALAEKRGKI